MSDESIDVRATARRTGLRDDVAAVALLAGIAAVAFRCRMPYLLFPELAALAYDVLTRPEGVWARALGHLVLTPLLAATAGTLIARHFGYGVLPILASVTVSLTLIGATRSPVAPAISAGLLPITLGLTTWRYPPALLFGTGVLATIAAVRTKIRGAPPPGDTSRPLERIEDLLEASPREYSWLPAYGGLIVLLALIAVGSGLRFVLYPPLAVIGFEMFAHSRVCPWSRERLRLPVACTVAAGLGTLGVHLLGANAVAVALTVAAGILVLRITDLHLPPALAIGLLPFVMPRPSFVFPVAVAAGTSVLSVGFTAWRHYRSSAAD